MLPDRIPVRHPRDVIRDLPCLPHWIALDLVIVRQQHRILQEGLEQLAHDAAGLHAHAVDLEVAVEVGVQEALEGRGLGAHLRREADQGRRCAHVVDALRCRFLE